MSDAVVGGLKAKLGLDGSEFKTGLDEAEKAADKFEGVIKDLGREIGVALSIGAVVEFGRAVVDAAGDSEMASRKLGAAFEAQGVTSKDALINAENLANALQHESIYSKEAIKDSERLLVSLSGLTGNGLSQAERAAMDLASGLGIDLQQATMLVAKAADGHTAALQRYGLAVKSTGDANKDFQTTLEKIEQKFGGQAQADLDTYQGKVSQLDHAWTDIKETIGNKVIPILGTAAEAWAKLFDSMADGEKKTSSDQLRKSADDVRKLVELNADLTHGQMWRGGNLAMLVQQELGYSDAMMAQALETEKGRAALLAYASQMEPTAKQIDTATAAQEKNAKATRDAAAAADQQAKLADQVNKALNADAIERERAAMEKMKQETDKGSDSIRDFFKITQSATTDDPFKQKIDDDKAALAALQEQVLLAQEGKGPIPDDWIGNAERLKTAIEQDELAEKKHIEQMKVQRAEAHALSVGLDTVGNALVAMAFDHAKAADVAKQASRALVQEFIHEAIAKITASAFETDAEVAAQSAPWAGPAAIAIGAAAAAPLLALIGQIPSFDVGGDVPGPVGQPMLATIHGGERILTADQVQRGDSGGRVVHEHHWHMHTVTGMNRSQTRRYIRDVFMPEFNAAGGLG